MTAVTHEALCRAKVCPFPSDPDAHRCVICQSPAVDHHHCNPRGMGGSKKRDVPENIVMLCRPHHEERTLNKWRDEIVVTNIGRFYIKIWGDGPQDRKAYSLPASSPVAEPSEEHLPREIAGSATVPGPGAARDDGDASEAAAFGQCTPFTSLPSSPGAPSPLAFRDNGIEAEPEYTLEDVRKAVEKIKSEVTGRQWRAGDIVNLSEGWQEAWQYLDEIDYPQETLANYANVARAYLIEDRRPLPFTFHQTVYKLPERLEWLDKALAEGWDRETLRESACGPRAPRVTKFSLDELREQAQSFYFKGNTRAEREHRNHGARYLRAFLASLEAE